MNTAKWLPRQFKKMNLTVFARANFDFAYINEPTYFETNTLNNRFIYGYGPAVDIILFNNQFDQESFLENLNFDFDSNFDFDKYNIFLNNNRLNFNVKFFFDINSYQFFHQEIFVHPTVPLLFQ